jgi:hypothetical protein
MPSPYEILNRQEGTAAEKPQENLDLSSFGISPKDFHTRSFYGTDLYKTLNSLDHQEVTDNLGKITEELKAKFGNKADWVFDDVYSMLNYKRFAPNIQKPEDLYSYGSKFSEVASIRNRVDRSDDISKKDPRSEPLNFIGQSIYYAAELVRDNFEEDWETLMKILEENPSPGQNLTILDGLGRIKDLVHSGEDLESFRSFFTNLRSKGLDSKDVMIGGALEQMEEQKGGTLRFSWRFPALGLKKEENFTLLRQDEIHAFNLCERWNKVIDSNEKLNAVLKVAEGAYSLGSSPSQFMEDLLEKLEKYPSLQQDSLLNTLSSFSQKNIPPQFVLKNLAELSHLRTYNLENDGVKIFHNYDLQRKLLDYFINDVWNSGYDHAIANTNMFVEEILQGDNPAIKKAVQPIVEDFIRERLEIGRTLALMKIKELAPSAAPFIDRIDEEIAEKVPERSTGDLIMYYLKNEDCAKITPKIWEKSREVVFQKILEGDEKTIFFLVMDLRFIKQIPSQIAEFLCDRGYINEIVENEGSFVELSPRIKTIGEIHKMFDQIDSQELKKAQKEIIEELIKVENPRESFRKIVNIFVKNNLPLVGKTHKIFDLLYPDSRIKEALNPHSSPFLNSEKVGPRTRRMTLFKDLVNVNIESANPSLRKYLELMAQFQDLLIIVEEKGVENINSQEKEDLRVFLIKAKVLLESSTRGRQIDSEEIQISPNTLDENYLQLKESLAVREGQTIIERISEMYLRPLGINRIEDGLSKMESCKKNAHERGIRLARNSLHGKLNLTVGDLIKGVDHQYIQSILENGSVAKEFLGTSSQSDQTPFDTDLSRVIEGDTENGFKGVIQNSIPGKGDYDYGQLLLIIKDHNQFQLTNPDTPRDQFDLSKKELFKAGLHGDRHYCVRTGLPSTEIDFMVAKDQLNAKSGEMEDIYFQIAKNGYYIPVADTEGNIVFTPEMYEERNKIINPRLTIERRDWEEVMSEYTPEKILDLLSKDFNDLLSSTNLGISENYTLRRHTGMVLEQFEKYFQNFSTSLFGKDQFRLILALHDIGKPAAMMFENNKVLQHKYTSEMMDSILNQLGFKRKEINLAVAVMGQDIIGKYFNNSISLEQAAKQAIEIAENEDVSALDLFEVMRIYNQVDGGSYTVDAGGTPNFDSSFVFSPEEGAMDYSEEKRRKIEQLKKEIEIATGQRNKIIGQ